MRKEVICYVMVGIELASRSEFYPLHCRCANNNSSTNRTYRGFFCFRWPKFEPLFHDFCSTPHSSRLDRILILKAPFFLNSSPDYVHISLLLLPIASRRFQELRTDPDPEPYDGTLDQGHSSTCSLHGD